MIDIGALIGIVISGFVLLGGCLVKFHIKKCHTLCIDSDCTRTPTNSTSDLASVEPSRTSMGDVAVLSCVSEV